MSSLRYRREFDKWLNDFKETDTYANIVNDYEECWSEIYKELHRRFKENIWNPSKLAMGFFGNDVSTNHQRNPENDVSTNEQRNPPADVKKDEEGKFYWWHPNPAKNGFKNKDNDCYLLRE